MRDLVLRIEIKHFHVLSLNNFEYDGEEHDGESKDLSEL